MIQARHIGDTTAAEKAGWGAECLLVLKVTYHRLLSSNKIVTKQWRRMREEKQLKNGGGRQHLTRWSKLASLGSGM